MDAIFSIVIALVTFGLGGAGGFFIARSILNNRLGNLNEYITNKRKEAEDLAQRLVKDAELERKEIEIQARQKVEEESKSRKKEIAQLEKLIFQKEENINRKTNYLDGREEEIRKNEKKIEQIKKAIVTRETQLEELKKEQVTALERAASMSANEAKQKLMDSMIDEAKHDSARKIMQLAEETKEKSEEKSRSIMALALQRYAGDYVTEKTVSVVGLPNDGMKGRIIGREGRNIRALEAATGIDLIIDDTPEAVVLSGFDPIRREVARMSLDKLIEDGRIHPARIEEIVKKCEAELDVKIKEYGQQAAFDLGIHGLHPEIIKLLGRLRFRTSYGQNVWKHSIEVGFLAGIMAAEIGMSVKQARRAGLLHDIGKALTHEIEGSHALIGGNVAKKYGESPRIVRAISAHHEEEEATLLSQLIQAADALSGARPGARREILESYVQRLEDLENIAVSFEGVEKSFAIQAGREVRVMVKANRVSDEDSVVLANDIAKKIENELTYPGQIKVVVIRETRATGIAS